MSCPLRSLRDVLACCSLVFATLVASCSLAFWPASARALALQWTAPASCPSQEQVQARIDALLHVPGKPVSGAEQSAQAHAKLSSLRSGFKLVLTLSGPGLGGTRTLSAKDCAELAETAAFLIAVAIDPSLPGAAPPVAEPTPPVAPPEPTPTAPATPLAPARTPPRAPETVVRALPFSLQAGLFGGAWSAGLPHTQGQLGVGVGAAMGRVQVELRGAHVFAAGEQVDGRPEAVQRSGTLGIRSNSLELAACHLWGARFFGGPCGSLTLVRSDATAEGFVVNPGGTLLWFNAAIAGQAGIRVNRWLEPFIDAGLGGPISKRPSFTVQAGGHLDGDRLLLCARLGVRFRWQPTRTYVAP